MINQGVRCVPLPPSQVSSIRASSVADPASLSCSVQEVSFWDPSPTAQLARTSRAPSCPDFIDVCDPYTLLLHQGLIERSFLDEIEAVRPLSQLCAPLQSLTSLPLAAPRPPPRRQGLARTARRCLPPVRVRDVLDRRVAGLPRLGNVQPRRHQGEVHRARQVPPRRRRCTVPRPSRHLGRPAGRRRVAGQDPHARRRVRHHLGRHGRRGQDQLPRHHVQVPDPLQVGRLDHGHPARGGPRSSLRPAPGRGGP